jgi:hypothetical protein
MMVEGLFDKGGSIVWMLLAYSFIALVLLFERGLHYLFMGKLPRDFKVSLAEVFVTGKVETFLEKLKGPDARIL